MAGYQDDEAEERDEGPDERDADLGWGGSELPYGSTLWQRTRQVAFFAILVLLLAAIIMPLAITATR